MFFDPILNFFNLIGFQWWSLWIFYALFNNLVDLIFLTVFNKPRHGGPGRYRQYLKDKVPWLLLPVFIMGGVSAVYLWLPTLTRDVAWRLVNHGFTYLQFQSRILSSGAVWIVCAVLAAGTSVFTLLRHFRETKLFFTQPKLFGVVRTIFFDFPLAYMIFTSIIRFVDQMVVLDRFYRSGWMPGQFLTADNFFGLKWAHTLLIFQIVVGLVLSFTPLIMLLRPEMKRHSKEYMLSPVLFIVLVAVPLFLLFHHLDQMLAGIHGHFTGRLMNQIFDIQASGGGEAQLKEILAYQKLNKVSTLPSGVTLPLILDGTVLASLLFWFGLAFDMVSGDLLDRVKEGAARFRNGRKGMPKEIHKN